MTTRHHVAILGAGPTGLEAALAAAEHGHSFTLYERGSSVGANIRAWGHVRLFSPWSMNVSPRMRRTLAAADVSVPDNETCPQGSDFVRQVLEPLSRTPTLKGRIQFDSRVVAVGRRGLLKHEEIGTKVRSELAFRILVRNEESQERVEEATTVIDTTGTWGHPNRVGDGGIPCPGEVEAANRIIHCIPDFATDRSWDGRTTLLIGAGHSAQTAVVGLADLASREPATRVVWALRRDPPSWHLDPADPLPERYRLTEAAARISEGHHPAVRVRAGVVVDQIEQEGGALRVSLRHLDGNCTSVSVDRILALTGFVGDASIYRQLQVHECYATSGTMKLAAALLAEGGGGGDCLNVATPGAETLLNPEPGFFVLGSKSYGRNNTFLMRTGWDQVDAVFSELLLL